MYKQHYKRFLSSDPDRLHFAAHSHHYWPDVTREAVLQYWDDAARYADRKWDHIFGKVIPEAQGHIAKTLNLSDPAAIAFAPNTHEFVFRLFSCLDLSKPLKILTTDSEFHSFSRQSARLEELPNVTVERVPTAPFETFEERFIDAARKGSHDMVFFSHVFFNSSWVVRDPVKIIRAVAREDALVAVDGYHAFRAIPTDLARLEGRAFYIAGGYKYAQTGEGACFMHIPKAAAGLRPLDTGWFSHYESLQDPQKLPVPYGDGASRFWGATFDSTGIYRFNAVMRWMERDGLTTEAVDDYVGILQQRFLDRLEAAGDGPLSARDLITQDLSRIGHFLTFRTPEAETIGSRLRDVNVIVDVRADRLRVGFGLYQDENDIDLFFERLAKLSVTAGP